METEGAGTVIVTGGGYGIGRAASELLARDGWKVVICDRDPDRAADTMRFIRASDGQAESVVGDVVDPATADKALAVAHSRFGSVTGLVTCAAMRHSGGITEVTAAQWDETIKVVLYGVFHFCKAVIPDMKAAGGGRIVNVSSPDSFGRKGMVAYATAKAGVNALTSCLAADHLADHIRVNAVLPGFTITGMTEHYSPERILDSATRSVAGRPGMPEDAAHLIAFLMSKSAETFTGGFFGNTHPPIR